MKPGARFRHFKGKLYTILGLAVTVTSINNTFGEYDCLDYALDAEAPTKRYAVFRLRGEETLRILVSGGALSPYNGTKFVLYRSETDGQLWIRTVENFTEELPISRGGGPRFYEVT
jgi:hypothetical protein